MKLILPNRRIPAHDEPLDQADQLEEGHRKARSAQHRRVEQRGGDIARRFRKALGEAKAFVRAMPAGKEGLLYLKDGRPVQPQTDSLADYIEHAGQRRGQRPSSSKIR